MRLRSLSAAALITAALTSVSSAGADTFTSFGAGSRSIALAGSGAALNDNSSAVFSSPANMAFGEPGLDIGFVAAVNRLTIKLSPRPTGYDPPDLGSASPVVPYRYRLTARRDPPRPPGVAGFSVGTTTSLGVSWLRLGVLLFLPVTGLGSQATYFSDEREQYFSNTLHATLYGDQLSSEQTMVAASFRLLPNLAVGGGMRFAIDSRSDASVLQPDTTDQTRQYIDLHTSTGFAVGALASASGRLIHDRLRWSATFRDRTVSQVQGVSIVQVNGFQGTTEYPFSQPMRFTLEYLPRQIVLAGAWQDQRWAASLDATFSQWSDFHDEAGMPAGFHDTWTVAAGGEWRVDDLTRLRGGLGYRPTPVPNQDGRTNYVDNDMWILGLGLTRELNIDDQHLDIAAFGQLQAAVPRTTRKRVLSQYPVCGDGVASLCDEVPDDTRASAGSPPLAEAQGLQTGNPGFPGFSSGGFVEVVGVELAWRYR